MSDKIEKVIDLAVPSSRVWRALTDHNEFGQWFRVKLDGPFKTGSVSTGRILSPGYQHLAWEAIVEHMDFEKVFSLSWHPNAIDSEADYSAEPRTIVEFQLEPTAEGTRLTITESGFSRIPDPRRLEAFRSNREGWDHQARNIAQHVST